MQKVQNQVPSLLLFPGGAVDVDVTDFVSQSLEAVPSWREWVLRFTSRETGEEKGTGACLEALIPDRY